MKKPNRTILSFGILVLAALLTCGIQQTIHADSPPVVYNPIAYEPIGASLTDGSVEANDCDVRPNEAIGCGGINPYPGNWSSFAVDGYHYLYYPEGLEQDGKLLVFLCGGEGEAKFCDKVFPAAAMRGYHVIGLTYPGDTDESCPQSSSCYGSFLEENITGYDVSEVSRVSDHKQDSVINRLIKVLEWASDESHNPTGHTGDLGWSRYLTGTQGHHGIDWTKVNLAGHSNGSSHASRMGMLYPSVGRVALFSGPNDGKDDPVTGAWIPTSYIELIPGLTDERYYGLVHYRNKSANCDDNKLYRVTNNWRKFGMADFGEPARFDPTPGDSPYFGESHMLISTDPCRDPDDDLPGTTYTEAHNSVVVDRYCETFDESGKCTELSEIRKIGYAAAWRCVLGAGHRNASGRPIANAGAPQTVECQGNGGANVGLDGSGTRDYDCEFLRYTWSGPFVSATGRNPTVFCPLGSNLVSLIASDDWWSSLMPSTTIVNVVDTAPPSLQVTVTPTMVWPPDHRLVRIDTTVNVADSCGGTSPQVVLTSVTSDQPDNGVADGDTINDIQGAEIGTYDRSFFVRAERAGNDPNGRTYTIVYTATDASGNQTQNISIIRVPLSQ